MQPEAVTLLEQVAPFDRLSPETRLRVAGRAELRSYPRHAYVFRQGEPSQGVLFLVAGGLAEITVQDERGRETVVGYRRPHDFFGETVVLTGKSYPAAVRALEDLRLLCIPREVFEELLDQHPGFAGFFTAALADRARDLYREVVAEQSYDAYGGEAEPRQRASQLMSAPVITCGPGETAAVVAARLAEHGISSLVVVDGEGRPLGLITEKELVRGVVAEGRDPTAVLAREVMERRLVSVPPGAYFYQILLAMVRQQVKHVVVLERERPVGVISIRDLVKSRRTGTLGVIDELEQKRSLAELAQAGRQVDQVLHALVAEKAAVPEVLAVMAEFHDRLARKVIRLCEEELRQGGYGTPVVPYCFVNMGSAGRREQTLRTDQDNAIIYEDPLPGQATAAEAYFLRLGERVAEGLQACGFARCLGNVMAANPFWCRSLSQWQRAVEKWITVPQAEPVRFLTILLDFRPVYGDPELAEALREHAGRVLHRFPVTLRHLAQDAAQSRVPINMLGQVIAERGGAHAGQLNLKKSALVHLVNCARVLALRQGLPETATLERLRRLAESGALPEKDAEYYAAAFSSLKLFGLRENLRRLARGEEPGDYLPLAGLSRREEAMLKDALRAAARLQSLTASSFLL